MGWTDDDIELGNIEIGEAIRGMQMGATPAATKVKAVLAKLAQQQFASHAPLMKRLGSQYKDSSAMGLNGATGNLTFSSGIPAFSPTTGGGFQFSASTIAQLHFKPLKMAITEAVTANFLSSGNVASAGYATGTANDLLILSANAGALNCLPYAPAPQSALAAATYPANGLGNGIAWPSVSPGISVAMGFILLPSAFGAVAVPSGLSLSSVNVTVNVVISGAQLRG